MILGAGWSWAETAYGWILGLGLVASLLALPMVLVRREGASRRRGAEWFVRAGGVALVLGHLAAFANGMEGWDSLRILGTPRRTDFVWVALDVAAPAAVGWAALAWAMLLVILVGLRDRVDGVLLLGAAILVPIIAGTLLLTTEPIPGELRRTHDALWGSRGVIVSHLPSLPGFFASAVAPLGWLLAPAGTLLSAAALRSWSRSRAAGEVDAAEAARRSLAESGLLVLSVSAVWITACVREVLGFQLVIGNVLSIPLGDLGAAFLESAWLPLLFAAWGLLATLLGALHFRPRDPPAP